MLAPKGNVYSVGINKNTCLFACFQDIIDNFTSNQKGFLKHL